MEGTKPNPTPEEVNPGEPPTDGRPEENRIAESQRKAAQAQKRASELEQQLGELTKWKEEREQADLSEQEKAQKRAEQAEARVQQAEAKAQRLERGGWLRDAAMRAGFNDPSDAIAFAESRGALQELDSEKKADKFVENLAQEKSHLLVAKQERTALGSLTSSEPRDGVPLDDAGNVDVKRGLGTDLLRHLTGSR